MIVVARPFDGITINENLEYLLDEDGNEMLFESKEDAETFLLDNGVTEDYMDILQFIEIGDRDNITRSQERRAKEQRR